MNTEMILLVDLVMVAPVPMVVGVHIIAPVVQEQHHLLMDG